MSLLDCVSTCQISDAYNEISRRSGVIRELKPINKLVWGRIATCKTNSDDWELLHWLLMKLMMVMYYLSKPIIRICLWGELASLGTKANGVKATIIYGSVRDLMLFIIWIILFCL